MKDKATQIVNRLLYDLTSRKGLEETWDRIDSDIKDEIKYKWIEIVRTILDDQSSLPS